MHVVTWEFYTKENNVFGCLAFCSYSWHAKCHEADQSSLQTGLIGTWPNCWKHYMDHLIKLLTGKSRFCVTVEDLMSWSHAWLASHIAAKCQTCHFRWFSANYRPRQPGGREVEIPLAMDKAGFHVAEEFECYQRTVLKYWQTTVTEIKKIARAYCAQYFCTHCLR